jgi:type 1 glutamine amidotransferase
MVTTQIVGRLIKHFSIFLLFDFLRALYFSILRFPSPIMKIIYSLAKRKAGLFLSAFILLLIATNTFSAIKIPVADHPGKKKIVFIAGACSHGPGDHEHTAGCMLLADQLKKYMGKEVETVVYKLWPKDTTVLESASTIVMYMDGAESHLALKHKKHLSALMKKGIGLVCLHYAVEVPKKTGGAEFINWLGGYFELDWSVNPHWEAYFKLIPKHEVTKGVKPFKISDEWYYHMRFTDDMKGVTPLLTALPTLSTLDRGMGPREGNRFVLKAVEEKQPQHVAWATERHDGGRAFGFTGGHFYKNFGDSNFRKIILNAIVWTAKVKVPATGVPTPKLTEADLQANLDTKPCPKL